MVNSFLKCVKCDAELHTLIDRADGGIYFACLECGKLSGA